MIHYTYLLQFTNGQKYIGVRSCKCIPKEDSKYLGSSKYTANLVLESKTILKEFPTRIDAVNHEIYLHNFYDVVKSNLFVNQAKQTTTKFDVSGAYRSPEHNKKIKDALTGRKRSKAECLAISIAKKGKSRKKHFPEKVLLGTKKVRFILQKNIRKHINPV